MKKYTLVFNVPDDFVPEEMDVNTSYKDDIELVYEGFANLEDSIKNAVSGLDIKESSVVIFKFPEWACDCPEQVQSIKKYIEDTVPCKCVLGIVGDVDILVEDSASAIDMLKNMINVINLRSSIKIQ